MDRGRSGTGCPRTSGGAPENGRRDPLRRDGFDDADPAALRRIGRRSREHHPRLDERLGQLLGSGAHERGHVEVAVILELLVGLGVHDEARGLDPHGAVAVEGTELVDEIGDGRHVAHAGTVAGEGGTAQEIGEALGSCARASAAAHAALLDGRRHASRGLEHARAWAAGEALVERVDPAGAGGRQRLQAGAIDEALRIELGLVHAAPRHEAELGVDTHELGGLDADAGAGTIAEHVDAARERDELVSDLAKVRAELVDLRTKLTEAQGQVTGLAHDLSRLQADKERLAEELAQERARIGVLEARRRELGREKTKLEQEKQELRRQVSEAQNQVVATVRTDNDHVTVFEVKDLYLYIFIHAHCAELTERKLFIRKSGFAFAVERRPRMFRINIIHHTGFIVDRRQLRDELAKLRKEQFNLRFQKATGQMEKTSRVGDIRRSIARIEAVLSEKSKKQTA